MIAALDTDFRQMGTISCIQNTFYHDIFCLQTFFHLKYRIAVCSKLVYKIISSKLVSGSRQNKAFTQLAKRPVFNYQKRIYYAKFELINNWVFYYTYDISNYWETLTWVPFCYSRQLLAHVLARISKLGSEATNKLVRILIISRDLTLTFKVKFNFKVWFRQSSVWSATTRNPFKLGSSKWTRCAKYFG